MGYTNFYNLARDNYKHFLFVVLSLSGASACFAQEGSQGNLSVGAGSQITFFGNHNFLAGASGALPGKIVTERAKERISYVNFSGANLTSSGAGDNAFIDGYVRHMGGGPFVFPTGDNGRLGQFSASGADISGAYFYANPSVAVTSNVFTGTNYPALPLGAPFNTDNMGAHVSKVSDIEYWDIDGANPTKVTLTWSPKSNISSLTSASLSKLAIVGWNRTVEKWEFISSSVDAVSVLGGASTLTSGSITTTSGIVPDTYDAYTFASISAADLTPAQFFSVQNIAAGQTIDYVVAISNVGLQETSGLIDFQVTNFPAASGLVVTPNTATKVTIDGDVLPLSNAEFNIATSTLRFTFNSKPGVVIANGMVKFLGFKIARSGGAVGSVNSTVTITKGTGGGETPTQNNTIANSITKL
ncbi:hypothetical protein LZD49_19880 [Dyadobacter sp. CY261]|uniref:hypothetical protein n=1 Tax=Dyadobacter sp. CY261 TaxID=2907203 RepID=UPI001F161929|nr:hypothetical protein [Dyadobacter sp. CY261]MCF0072750.1 hypothetical protein [Dyadobacter sp. CY261]